MGLKHTRKSIFSKVSETVFESPQWSSFIDRHTEDRSFRYTTRAAGIGLLALGTWLGYKGVSIGLNQLPARQENLDTQRYLSLGGAFIALGTGVPLTLFGKQRELPPSFAEQDAMAKAALAPAALRPDLDGQLSVGELELEAALVYYDADEAVNASLLDQYTLE